MGSKRIFCVVVGCAVAAVGIIATNVSEVSAQGYRKGESRRYVPQRPTFGDAFLYARDDVGLLTDYHTFVQPQRQLRSTLQQQSNIIATQEDEIRNLQNEVNTVAPGATPTGKGGTFMNYSHYYSRGGGRSRR